MRDSVTPSDLLARGHERLTIACPTCGRRGEYDVPRLRARRGEVRLTDFLAQVTADCPRRAASANIYERCGAVFEGLA